MIPVFILNKLHIVAISVILSSCLMMSFSFIALAEEDEEAVLLFSYKRTGPHYINAIYSRGSFYLPLSELFSLLCLHHEFEIPQNIAKGKWYDPEMSWRLDFESYRAEAGREVFLFSSDDVRVGNADLYLKPDMFEKVFKLRFEINMSTLTLKLAYEGKLPVEGREERKRMHMEIAGREDEPDDIPVAYPRKRQLFKAGVADYNIGIVSGNSTKLFNYLLKGGAENE